MRGLTPLSSPAWYRGFDPIAVPWGEGGDSMGALPDILSFARQPQSPQGAGQGPGSGQGAGGGTSSGSGLGSAQGRVDSILRGYGYTGTAPRDQGGDYDWEAIIGIINAAGRQGAGRLPPEQPQGAPPPPTAPSAPTGWGQYQIIRELEAVAQAESDPAAKAALEREIGVLRGIGTPDQAAIDDYNRQLAEYEAAVQAYENQFPPGWQDTGDGGAGGAGGSGGSGGGGGNGQPTTPPPPLPPTDWGFGIDIPDRAWDRPDSIDFKPDLTEFGPIGGLIGGGSTGNIPQFMPGETGGTPNGGGGGGGGGGGLSWIGNAAGVVDGIKSDNPGEVLSSIVGFINPAAGAIMGAFNELLRIGQNKNPTAREQEREWYNEVGQEVAGQVLGNLWGDVLDRNPDWIFDPWKGAGQSDADFVSGWKDWLSTSGVGGRPETPFQNFGKLGEAAPYAIGQSFVDYLNTLPQDRWLAQGEGGGEWAPGLYLQREYGFNPQFGQLAPGGGDWGSFSGLGQAGQNAYNAYTAVQSGDPEWRAWLESFSAKRPGIALDFPQWRMYQPQPAAATPVIPEILSFDPDELRSGFMNFGGY
jgi:hypothetical protein